MNNSIHVETDSIDSIQEIITLRISKKALQEATMLQINHSFSGFNSRKEADLFIWVEVPYTGFYGIHKLIEQ